MTFWTSTYGLVALLIGASLLVQWAIWYGDRKAVDDEEEGD